MNTAGRVFVPPPFPFYFPRKMEVTKIGQLADATDVWGERELEKPVALEAGMYGLAITGDEWLIAPMTFSTEFPYYVLGPPLKGKLKPAGSSQNRAE